MKIKVLKIQFQSMRFVEGGTFWYVGKGGKGDGWFSLLNKN